MRRWLVREYMARRINSHYDQPNGRTKQKQSEKKIVRLLG